LTLARNAEKGIFDRSKFKFTHDISLTISGWLLLINSNIIGFDGMGRDCQARKLNREDAMDCIR